MRFLLTLLFAIVGLAAQAGPPQLLLDVARFRNLNKVEKGAEVEIYVTVPTQSLTYRQRAPKAFQSAATVTLDILKADGKSAYHEVVTLKPPVLNDTTIAIKNPQSFLKRIMLPDGNYTLRGTVKDQYRSAGGETTVEKPLVLEAPTGPFLTDVVLLSRPAARSGGDDNFARGGYRLTRAPGGVYGRGADNIFFYTELHNAPVGQPLRVHYHLTTPDGSAADADATLTSQSGRPTTVVGQLPLGPLPDGPFTLFVEVYGGPGNKKLLAGHRAIGARSSAEYAPAGAAVPR
ncbi:hypothetical protein Q3A66_19445 [Hymenobacter sp. BT770]|uniref:hypothetical protein n=1 Tax=Hymenobacter sp. BT770 TaxID=2886942 RepID=UPI001D12F249|nr:hypothetical protein [Hymenobacter sp. BT770]MCC3155286.1 hypothetical protein [Hymenobacter sp. BT770]MDO3417249.1 hypothetical protein [Hymenobacter sp. BT770]